MIGFNSKVKVLDSPAIKKVMYGQVGEVVDITTTDTKRNGIVTVYKVSFGKENYVFLPHEIMEV